MLKVYKVYNYISIDGTAWRRVVRSWMRPTERKISDKPLETQHILCDASFDEAYHYLHNHRVDGAYDSSNYCIGKITPIIRVRYKDAHDDVNYRRFDTMSYKIEYEEWKDVTLKWIMENLPADTAIQYLKERGITTCPMNF